MGMDQGKTCVHVDTGEIMCPCGYKGDNIFTLIWLVPVTGLNDASCVGGCREQMYEIDKSIF